MFKRHPSRWGLLADRYGVPIKGYWQTVKVCQLEIIGRPFAKYVNGLLISSFWEVLDARLFLLADP